MITYLCTGIFDKVVQRSSRIRILFYNTRVLDSPFDFLFGEIEGCFRTGFVKLYFSLGGFGLACWWTGCEGVVLFARGEAGDLLGKTVSVLYSCFLWLLETEVMEWSGCEWYFEKSCFPSHIQVVRRG